MIYLLVAFGFLSQANMLNAFLSPERVSEPEVRNSISSLLAGKITDCDGNALNFHCKYDNKAIVIKRLLRLQKPAIELKSPDHTQIIPPLWRQLKVLLRAKCEDLPSNRELEPSESVRCAKYGIVARYYNGQWIDSIEIEW